MAILSRNGHDRQAAGNAPARRAPAGTRTHDAQGQGRAAEAGAGGALGNNAIFPALSGPTGVDLETGEIRRIEFDRAGKPVLARPTPYERALRSYQRKAIVDDLCQLLPPREDGQPHRLYKCRRVPLPGSQVALMFSHEYRKAFFAGLQICANPWLCPHCMRKISERKRAEVLSGIEIAKAMGRRAVLMTLTFRHDSDDRLAPTLKQLLQAYEHGFSKNKGGKAFKKALGLLGTIKATEITWGRTNGHHPHLHVLMFVAGDAPDAAAIRELASGIWTKACKKVGRYADPEIGTNVQEGNEAGRYISKMGLDKDEQPWGLDAELTKGSSKNGRATGFSMLQVVDLAGDDDKAAIAAWLQYAKATEGKHPLRWSNGLRKALGMGPSRTDEELANEPEDESARIFSLLTRKGWKLVKRERLEPVLEHLAAEDPDRAIALIADIEQRATKEKS